VRHDDPAAVAREYASEARLAARAAIYRHAEGPSPLEVAFGAVAEARPRLVLEVGCGPGEFSERLGREAGVEATAVDLSERMVELTRARGVEARVADVRALPFPDAAFDAVVANFVLFHVSDVDRAVGEAARVLRPGGRFVATTIGRDHLRELLDLVGAERPPTSFDAEDAEAVLLRRFSRVERRDGSGWVTFPDRDAAQAYVDASIWGEGRRVPPFAGALRVRRSASVFVAEGPRGPG
jgi:SAM-dependent methyltransferase